MKITGKELQKWGVPSGPAYKVILDTLNRLDMHRKQAQRAVLALRKNPKHYLNDKDWGDAAKALMPRKTKSSGSMTAVASCASTDII